MEDRRISAKSITEQLGISHDRVGPIIHEDLDMRKVSVKWVPKCLNADQKLQQCQMSEQLLEFFRSDPNDFLSRLVTMGETWLYHYDPETKQQSIEWRHRDSPRPQKIRVKNPLEKFSPRFFGGIKAASSSLIIFQSAKILTRSINQLSWWNWRVFWRKNAAGSLPRWSWSCTTKPRLTGHLQPRRNWPTWASSVLVTHPILRIWPRRAITCSLDWKTIARPPFFVGCGGHCCRGELVGRTIFWFFFRLTCKSQSNGLRSVLSFVGSMLNISRGWSL